MWKVNERVSGVLLCETQAGDGYRLPAQIREATDATVVVYVPQPLTRSQKVRLLESLREHRAVVSHCQAQQAGFLVTLQFLDRERRREDRPLTIGTAALCWTDQNRWQSEMVRVINVTEQGVQVEIKQALPVHQLVRLSGEAWQCLGHVRYCSTEGLNFLAGIEFCQPAHPKDSPDYRESLDYREP